MSDLSIANVISVSIATPQTGLGAYNTSNLALFTSEVYDSGSFGSAGYKIYLSPVEVADDFGSDSRTYAMALAVFSQQPNILAGGGYLVIIPMVYEVQSLAFSGTPVSGVFKLNFAADITAAINYNDNAATIQTAVRTLTGLEQATVTGSIPAGVVINFNGYYGNAALMTVSDNTMATSGPVAVTVTVTQTTAGETLATAVTRTVGLIQYFGIMAANILPDADIPAAAAVVQALMKLVFFVSYDSASVETSGVLDDLATAGYWHSRGLFYGGAASDDTSDEKAAYALGFMAAYAGFGLSTDFNGSNTTKNLDLKGLTGVLPDATMDQTLFNKCQAAGADVYASVQGVPKILSSGANEFYDNAYNLLAYAGDIEVAGFNVLATNTTKIPQTENGMDILKGAWRQVSDKYVRNGFIAPGTWTNPTTFGNQVDLYANILQVGYYIYSTPISQQLPADRVAREAPLSQIAIKYAGAINKASVIINVNA